ncbi:Ribonuclease P protein component [Asticcacaulis sp. MM231]|uniref:ribonuclease P protein component n=1 Tax=Asticcacaulis sp. MM231 TaxID=3157666 RepID=UPI0032D5801F
MIPRLKIRAEFLAAAKAAYQARPGVVVQAKTREDDAIKVGFTATKKIGNAVVRNRAKRRMREAAEVMIPQFGRPGHDYVLIARADTVSRDWNALLDDVKAALIRLAAKSVARPKAPITTDVIKSEDTPQETKTVR